MTALTREQVLSRRIRAQQLDREVAPRPLTDAAILDLGVQETGRDAASWALANRGVPVANAEQLYDDPGLALAWTLRGAPHVYRRAELPDVLTAVSPFSEADAAKRMINAAGPLEQAGIGPREGLSEVARVMRAVVDRPRAKGDVSTALTARLAEPYLRDCRPCDATHPWEMPFRFAALYGGLELEPGTSPPVLRRIPGWPRRPAGPAADPDRAPTHLDVVRGYLRFLGPAAPAQVAGFLDGATADVKARWPADAVEVVVGGRRSWVLEDDGGSTADGLDPPGPELVRLLGGYDLLLQGKDRDLLLPDKSRHKVLWPTIGRPGAVLVGTELVGAWRPRASGRGFGVQLDLWAAVARSVRQRIEDQAERLAGHRGLAFRGLTEASS